MYSMYVMCVPLKHEGRPHLDNVKELLYECPQGETVSSS